MAKHNKPEAAKKTEEKPSAETHAPAVEVSKPAPEAMAVHPKFHKFKGEK